MKISIITINYNGVDGLEKTINSIVKQTYNEIEYLVIDGGSNDGSLEIIKRYSQDIDYFVSESDHGIYHAMNKGINASSGSYLLFINSGDFLINYSIIELLVNRGLYDDLVFGNLVCFDAHKEWVWNSPTELSFYTFYASTIPHPATLIKRTLFNEVGRYDEHLKIVSDWKFFMLAVVKFNCSYRHIDTVITAYDFHGISSKLENASLIDEERALVLREEFSLFVSDYNELSQFKKDARDLRRFIRAGKIFRKISKTGKNL